MHFAHVDLPLTPDTPAIQAGAVVAAEVAEDDDEADALAVVSAPAIGAPAMLIALVDPN